MRGLHSYRFMFLTFQLSSPHSSRQVLSSAGLWQPLALDHNQVAVFAGETLEYATAGAIHAALHRVSQSEVRRMPRCSRASAGCACSILLCTLRGSVLRAFAICDHLDQRDGRISQARSSPRVSFAYKQRPAPYAIIDMRNVPNFVPNNRCVALLLVDRLRCWSLSS